MQLGKLRSHKNCLLMLVVRFIKFRISTKVGTCDKISQICDRFLCRDAGIEGSVDVSSINNGQKVKICHV